MKKGFSELVGNQNAAAILKRLAASGDIPGSLLFAGPDGVGKKLFAIEFARSILCSEATDGEACGVCHSCVRVGEFDLPNSDKSDDFKTVFLSKHPDVGIVFTAKRILPVDAIRALEREANIRPFEGAKRIFIIDDAEKMNDSSANALLKTLEEPPATSHLILISSRPDRLLPTIRSRVQTVRFAPAAEDIIVRYLTDERGVDTSTAQIAASVSEGSVSRAAAFDPAAYNAALEMFENLLSAGGDCARALAVSETLSDAKNKDRFEANLEMLQALLRRAFAIKAGSPSAEVAAPAALQKLAARASLETIAQWITEIDLLLQNLIVNINRKVATDALFVKIAAAA